jgi:phosphoribosylformylglycinamidine synthase
MGAAGLTCSTCEMAARGDTGIEIDLSLVPQRETGMTAYEMLLSESQERMLIVAHKGREREVGDIFRKWDLDAVVIGQVRDDGRMRVAHNGEVVCDVPVKALTDEAPIYDRPMRSADILSASASEARAQTSIERESSSDVRAGALSADRTSALRRLRSADLR